MVYRSARNRLVSSLMNEAYDAYEKLSPELRKKTYAQILNYSRKGDRTYSEFLEPLNQLLLSGTIDFSPKNKLEEIVDKSLWTDLKANDWK